MKSTKIDPVIQRSINDMQKQYPVIREIVSEISQLGGRVFLVGGAVRDLLLGLPIKDIDIEVHGITLDELICFKSRPEINARQNHEASDLAIYGIENF